MAVLLLTVPQKAQAGMLDLTTNISGTLNNAFFIRATHGKVGTGVFEPFVRIHASGTEKGYNTDSSSPQPDVLSAAWCESLLLSNLPRIDLNNDGTYYREFALDINEDKGGDDEYLSLDTINIHIEATGDKNTVYDTGFSKAIYKLGAGNYVMLDYTLGRGSGKGIDLLAYVPDSYFPEETPGVDQFVYLYSEFGGSDFTVGGVTKDCHSDDGFEEWGMIDRTGTYVIPEPASMLLLTLGIFGFGIIKRKRR